MQITVDVDLALVRPPTKQRTSRVTLIDVCCAHHGELQAISMAAAIHGAEMSVGSVVVDWTD